VGLRSLGRGGTLAALVAVAIYVLLGGEIDLNGNDSATTTSPPAAEITNEASSPAPAPAGDANLSQEESEGIAQVLAMIEAGSPLPYGQDGTSFQNREGRLPQRADGYYREYTVITPGSDDRGARRLVIGGGGETFYTADHYESFAQIDPEQFR
jgi:ribonuclease T1